MAGQKKDKRNRNRSGTSNPKNCPSSSTSTTTATDPSAAAAPPDHDDKNGVMSLLDQLASLADPSQFVHIARSDMYFAAADSAVDTAEKLRLIDTASTFADTAATHGPFTFFNHLHHASLLYQSLRFPNDGALYRKVIRVCDQAIGVADSIDPAEEVDVSPLHLRETRIGHSLQLISDLRRNAEYCAENGLLEVGPWAASSVVKSKALDFLRSLSGDDRQAFNLCSVSARGLGELVNLNALRTMADDRPTLELYPCCYCKDAVLTDAFVHKIHVLEKHVGAESEMDFPSTPNDHLIRRVASCWNPLVDSSNAGTELLGKIRHVFEILVKHKTLTVAHLCYLSRFAGASVFNLQPERNRMKNPLLRSILDFFEELHKLAGIDESNEEASSADSDDVGEDLETLVDWLYVDSSCKEDYRVAWNKMLIDSRQFIEKLHVEISLLCQLCKERAMYLDAWSSLESLKGSESFGLQQLVERREVLSTTEGFNRVEMDAISEVFEEDASESLDEQIKRLIDRLAMQVCRIDARIMGTQRAREQLEEKIKHASFYDYRIALVQQMRSILLKRLEDRVNQKAFEWEATQGTGNSKSKENEDLSINDQPLHQKNKQKEVIDDNTAVQALLQIADQPFVLKSSPRG